MIKIVLGLLILAFVLSAGQDARAADTFKRKISLEWEPIKDAQTYEVQVQKEGAPKPKSANVKEAQWQGMLEMGRYSLRVRARDKRKVPGDWSVPSDFDVGLENAALKLPKADQKINSSNDDTESVDFKWEKVPGAIAYQVSVQDASGKILQTKKVDSTSVSFKLPVAAVYQWQVLGLGPEKFTSSEPTIGKFTVIGAGLKKPELHEPSNKFVRQLGWEPSEHADNYDYVITKYEAQGDSWIVVDKQKGYHESKTPFSQKYPGGRYKITLRAQGPYRQPSKISDMTFEVAKGNRSPAAEERAEMRESIDRTSNWFGIASYLITGMNYTGQNSDRSPGQPLTINFQNAIGGTGRVGLGYLSDRSAWGFLSILDYSGITLNSTVVNYMTYEANTIYRTIPSDRTEIRQLMGVFYKQFPNIQATAAGTVFPGTVAAAGPHYGAEYWYAMSRKLGFQVNAHGYLNALSISTPNGNPVQMGLSYQLGVLGSYRLSQKATGLLGYALRNDSVSYQATDGSTNTSSVVGNYINLLLEWQL